MKSHWQPLESGSGYEGIESLFIATKQSKKVVGPRKFVAASYPLSQGFFWGYITIAAFTTLLRIGIFAFVNHERATISGLIYASVKLLFSPLGVMIGALTAMLLGSEGIQREELSYRRNKTRN